MVKRSTPYYPLTTFFPLYWFSTCLVLCCSWHRDVFVSTSPSPPPRIPVIIFIRHKKKQKQQQQHGFDRWQNKASQAHQKEENKSWTKGQVHMVGFSTYKPFCTPQCRFKKNSVRTCCLRFLIQKKPDRRSTKNKYTQKITYFKNTFSGMTQCKMGKTNAPPWHSKTLYSLSLNQKNSQQQKYKEYLNAFLHTNCPSVCPLKLEPVTWRCGVRSIPSS